ncbi:MAG: hypothetical protein HUU41_10825 [Bryobacteraceae bacterium]|nr:hypothetical protein [Bryobacterales bacterium]NUN01600.1 hypothetical protein [Bryobacteraceae bacterium]
MATTKVTFTLAPATIQTRREAAERLAVPKSEIVREAIMEFHDRLGRLSERERISMLRAFDELVPKIPARSPKAVSRELAELREARGSRGRRTAMRKRA